MEGLAGHLPLIRAFVMLGCGVCSLSIFLYPTQVETYSAVVDSRVEEMSRSPKRVFISRGMSPTRKSMTRYNLTKKAARLVLETQGYQPYSSRLWVLYEKKVDWVEHWVLTSLPLLLGFGSMVILQRHLR
jgi:hypothetical protein